MKKKMENMPKNNAVPEVNESLKRIKKLVAQTMIDKKEITDLKTYQAILDLIGRNTPEGREAIRKIGVFNPLLNIEAKLREERNIPLGQPLSDAYQELILNELKEKLQGKLTENKLGEIKSMSPDFFKDPRFRESVKEVFADPVDMAQLVRGAPRDMRVALKGLPGTVKGEKLSVEEGSKIITPPPEITGQGEETQKSREEILRELEIG